MGAEMHHNARRSRIMVVADLAATIEDVTQAKLDFVFSNTWGEIFAEAYPFQEGLGVIEKYVKNLKIKNAHEMSEKVKIHMPKSTGSKTIRRTIYQSIMQGLQA